MATRQPKTAVVLSGGASLGAVQAGMDRHRQTAAIAA
jgi:predicted acylesterase/phospholipase RssA